MRINTPMFVGLLISTIFALGGAPAAWAEERQVTCPICRSANDPNAPYAQHAGATLVRGALNTAFGWTEMLIQPVDEVKAGGSLVAGFGKGISSTMTRTGAGIGELFTFWVPRRKESLPLITTCPISRSNSSPEGRP